MDPAKILSSGAFLFLSLLIFGCLAPDRDADESPPVPPLTQRWLAPYLKGTPDSLLIGDFAPTSVGDTWVYHEVTTRSVRSDTQWIARVEVRILSAQTSDSGRIIRIGFHRIPLYLHCSASAYGKTWEWDEIPPDTVSMDWNGEYLETGGAFLQRDSGGVWELPKEAYGPRFHKVLRSEIQLDRSFPAYDTLYQKWECRSIHPIYARNVGLILMDSTPNDPIGT